MLCTVIISVVSLVLLITAVPISNTTHRKPKDWISKYDLNTYPPPVGADLDKLNFIFTHVGNKGRSTAQQRGLLATFEKWVNCTIQWQIPTGLHCDPEAFRQVYNKVDLKSKTFGYLKVNYDEFRAFYQASCVGGRAFAGSDCVGPVCECKPSNLLCETHKVQRMDLSCEKEYKEMLWSIDYEDIPDPELFAYLDDYGTNVQLAGAGGQDITTPTSTDSAHLQSASPRIFLSMYIVSYFLDRTLNNVF